VCDILTLLCFLDLSSRFRADSRQYATDKVCRLSARVDTFRQVLALSSRASPFPISHFPFPISLFPFLGHRSCTVTDVSLPEVEKRLMAIQIAVKFLRQWQRKQTVPRFC
jgi:hypothetical protein